MATSTIGVRKFLDSSFNHGKGEVRQFENILTLEQDTSTGALTLSLNGSAVSSVAPHANPALVTIVNGQSQSVNMPAVDFVQLVVRPVGKAAGQFPPPDRELGQAWQGWAIARLIQLGVTLDTALRNGSRFVQ